MREERPVDDDVCHIGRHRLLEELLRKRKYFAAETEYRGGEALGNQSLTEEERMQIEGRIAALEIEHQDLDDVIARLSEHPDQDPLQLRRFKKRKLILKDSISRLKILLVPDIPA
jgi:hypothetical protein